jgi:glutathione S-transferase
MLRLYDYWESGNCYKVRLLLSQLEQRFERMDVNILEGETRTPEFLAKNPNHRVPLAEWPDGRRLAESNAILFYLADGTPYLSPDPWERAQTLQWQCFEQYSHEPFIAVVRFWHFAGTVEAHRNELPGKMNGGYHALDVMEKHLADREFFVGDRYSIADISLYAYTHVADEGEFDLQPYPNIRRWLDRVKAQPRHVELTDAVGIPVVLPEKPGKS